MPNIKCSAEDCEYETGEQEVSICAELLKIHAIDSHSRAPVNPISNSQVEKLKRPTIKQAGTTGEWGYFKTRWAEYRDGTRLKGADIVAQLLECCEEDLRRKLTSAAGGTLTKKTEEEVMHAIETLAVRRENAMVSRVTLHKMTQDHGEAIRSFGSRVQGQAGICKFITPCPKCSEDVDYTDCIVKDVVVIGMADSEIQLDVLGDPKQDMTLEETFQFEEVRESGKLSASRLVSPHSTNAASAYRNVRKQQAERDPNKTEPCGYCGRKGHGKSAPFKVRSRECPAYGHKCEHCEYRHHLESMCRSANKMKPSKHGANLTDGADAIDCQGALFDTLCNIMVLGQHRGRRTVALGHHQYSNLRDEWLRQTSKGQPFVNVTLRTEAGDYRDLGFKLNTTTKTVSLPALADTGCQSCLIGTNTLHKLGLKQKDLIPVTMKMRAANDQDIGILGAVVVRFSGTGKGKAVLETRQMTYVTDATDKIFLSREACVALGMIAQDFPSIGCANKVHSLSTPHQPSNGSGTIKDTPKCACPQRTMPPAPPKLPFPATEGNMDKLRQYLLDHYASSTFNTCPHQPLPMMEGPPMRLIIDDSASPVAHHNPIPVPLHWQDKVKAGLDQDVQLGVIEPVPVGTPVTWCHRMVICPKKDGQPRYTVDFQPLNTHHIQSPFHQA